MRKRQHRRARPGPVAGPVVAPPERPSGLLDALHATRGLAVDLGRDLEAHRQQLAVLLKEINRRETDTRMLCRIVDVLDTFELLLSRADGDTEALDAETYRAGLQRTAGRLTSALWDNSDIVLIGRLGEIADPTTHEVLEVRDDGAPADRVLEVVARGFRFRGELVRPATVIVSSGLRTSDKSTISDKDGQP